MIEASLYVLPDMRLSRARNRDMVSRKTLGRLMHQPSTPAVVRGGNRGDGSSNGGAN